TSTVGSVFLGLTVGCAKCHDHKYDSIPTRDFYRMKAFFATVQITNTGRAGGDEPADFYPPGEKKWADESRQKLKEELESAEKEFAAFQKPLIAKAAEAIKRTDPQHDKEVTEKDVERLINVESNNAASLDKTSDVFTANEKQS